MDILDIFGHFYLNHLTHYGAIFQLDSKQRPDCAFRQIFDRF